MTADPDDALVLRARTRSRGRWTRAAGVAVAVAGLALGLSLVVAGEPLVGLIIVGWCVYVAHSWLGALRRPVHGPEILRMDRDRVTVRHLGGRAGEAAWSVAWPHVQSVTVREVALPAPAQERFGPATKVVTIDVLDHRDVDGPADHRERLFPRALLTGTTTSRARMEAFLADSGPDAVRRLAAWLGEHHPEVGFDIDVTPHRMAAAEPPPGRVGVLATGPDLQDAIVEHLRTRGLRPSLVAADTEELLTDGLRECTALIAVDADPERVEEAAATAGLDRVLLAVSDDVDTSALVRSDRVWTVLTLSTGNGTHQQAGPALDPDDIAQTAVALLVAKDSVRRTWRPGPDGVPVAATG